MEIAISGSPTNRKTRATVVKVAQNLQLTVFRMERDFFQCTILINEVNN